MDRQELKCKVQAARAKGEIPNVQGADPCGAGLQGKATQIDARWALVLEILNQGAAQRNLADLSSACLNRYAEFS